MLMPYTRLGVPYQAWRITHANHHAHTGHMTQDQVFVPRTRSELGLPAFDPAKEDLAGSSVSEEVMNELWDALGDSPIGAVYGSFRYLVSVSFPRFLLLELTASFPDWWLACVSHRQRVGPNAVSQGLKP